MAFSSLNPYQYLAVYFDFFVGPVTQLSNICLIISIYLAIKRDRVAELMASRISCVFYENPITLLN